MNGSWTISPATRLPRNPSMPDLLLAMLIVLAVLAVISLVLSCFYIGTCTNAPEGDPLGHPERPLHRLRNTRSGAQYSTSRASVFTWGGADAWGPCGDGGRPCGPRGKHQKLGGNQAASCSSLPAPSPVFSPGCHDLVVLARWFSARMMSKRLRALGGHGGLSSANSRSRSSIFTTWRTADRADGM